MPVTMKVDRGVGHVLIDRPQKRNALDLECFFDLERIVERVATSGVRVVAVRAAESPAFCAGADIADLDGISPETANARADYRRQVLQRFSELRVPTVAIIDGYALGGGVELAAACTFRLATPRSTFSFPEIHLGYLPGAGGTQRIPRLIGRVRTLDLMLTGRVVAADEALRIGLIDRLVDHPQADADAFVELLASRDPEAVGAILAAVGGCELPLREGLAIEGRHLAVLNGSAAAQARVAAFLNKKAN